MTVAAAARARPAPGALLAFVRRAFARPIVRFLFVGVLNTLFGYGVFAVATLLGASGLPALAISTCAGIAFNFQTSRRLVFRTAARTAARAAGWRFAGLYLALLAANWAALAGLEALGVAALAAQACLLLPFAGLSFAGQKLLVFGDGAGIAAGRLHALRAGGASRRLRPRSAGAWLERDPLLLFAGVLGAADAAFLLGMLSSLALAVAAAGVIALSVAAIFGSARPRTSAAERKDAARLWAVAVAVALGLCLLGGEGRLLYANTDWQIRDAVMADLSNRPWPVRYVVDGQAGVLRAPLGMYMLPSLAGRWLGWRAAAPVLLAQNAALLAGVLVVFLGAARRWPARIAIVAAFIAFSGWDAVGALLFGLPLPNAGQAHLLPSLEWWGVGLQFSSMMTDLFWAPNHALPAWIMAAGYVAWRRGVAPLPALAALTGLCLLWSPLAVMGALPFMALAGLTELRRRPRGLFALAAAAPLALALFPVALYLGLGSGGVEHGANLAGARLRTIYPIFLLLELAPLAALALLAGGEEGGVVQADVALATLMLALIPLYRIGGSNDFMMRASIVPLTLLFVRVAQGLARTPPFGSKPRAVAIGAALALGAVTPAFEIARALVEPPTPPQALDLITAWRAPASRGTSKATYIVPQDVFARAAWLFRRPSD